MAMLMWTIWAVGTVVSLVTIYVLLRVLYAEEKFETESGVRDDS